jgi:FGGY-family pentulose kinase
MKTYLGIDVGTGSARAGLFDDAGRILGRAQQDIETFRPCDDFVEQSSNDIWRAVCAVSHQALQAAGVSADGVRGVGFDATCSLVALDSEDHPVSLSPTGQQQQNIIVWMDHRAAAEADFVNRLRHDVLRYVGGNISIEMQIPKLLWIKRYLPQSWQKTVRFFDLPDFLTYRATSRDIRSQCSLVCKWTYLGHANEGRGAWSRDFFEKAGLLELLSDGARRIGGDVRPLGTKLGELSEQASREMGLRPGTAVGVSIIDAHAGGLGLLGMPGVGASPSDDWFDDRVALIGGTSSCHMAVSAAPRFVPGVWGPYFNALVPGMWLNEGGQSATGALIDHTIESHARFPELKQSAQSRGATVYELLNQRLADMDRNVDFPAALTRDLHVLPYHHGNRSPRADASLRGMVSGLRLSDALDQLALLYLATIQAIGHGTRHIIETLNMNGYQVSTLLATGGDTKNPIFLREHADITGCEILLPESQDAVLLGSAILGATADGRYTSLPAAMRAMSRVASRIAPATGQVREFHDAKHRVFFRMYHDQQAYRSLMGA